MTTLRTGLYAAGRVRYGAAILAAGETVDVTRVQKRFDAFAAEHYAYMGAHGTVQAALSLLRQRQAVVDQLDLKQDEAVERVAKRLVADGHTRANPFAAYNVAAPSTVMTLNFGAKATAIHTLVDMLQTDTTLSQPTRRTAQEAEAAARSMEAELIPFEKLRTSVRTARTAREAAGKKWDAAFTALKLDARAADAEGAPGLETALLGRPTRSKKPATGDKKPPASGKQPKADEKQQTAGDKDKADDDKEETPDKTAPPAPATPAAKGS